VTQRVVDEVQKNKLSVGADSRIVGN
jgi:hypothetical protein